MNIINLLIPIFITTTLLAKEIPSTCLLHGLYTNKSHHFQKYESDWVKIDKKYNKGKNKDLNISPASMLEIVGKNSYRNTNITSIIPIDNVFKFDIDSTILAFHISLQNKNTSKNATVHLYDPNGELVTHDSSQLVKVADTAAASFIDIKSPLFGRWKMVFDKKSDFTGKITAITPMRVFGFSFLETAFGRHGLMDSDIDKPKIMGSRSKVLLTSEKLYQEESLKVKLININNNKIEHLKNQGYILGKIFLKRSRGFANGFDVYVEGKDINGYPFTRKSKLPIFY